MEKDFINNRNKNKNILQKNFKIIRDIIGFTDEEFAISTGTTKQTISNIECGKYLLKPSMYLLIRYILDDYMVKNPYTKQTKELKNKLIELFGTLNWKDYDMPKQ